MSTFIARGMKEIVIEPSANYVDYLESTGTQFINTEFVPNQDTSVKMIVSDWNKGEWSTSVFGSRASTAQNGITYMLLQNASGSYRSDYGTQQLVNFKSATNCKEKTEIYRNKNVTTIGTDSVTNNEKTFTCTYPLYIFGTCTGGSLSHGMSGKIYYCEIYDGDVLVRDFRPCFDPEGVACMYEEVEQKYYYNAGSGDFVGGMEE